jgi:hypothetical protein
MNILLNIYYVETVVSKKNNFSVFTFINHIHIRYIINALISPFC